MNDPVEHRLRDLFDAIESQIIPRPLLDSSGPDRMRTPRALAVARAAVIVMVLGTAVVLMLSMGHAKPNLDKAAMPPTTVDGNVFDARVAEFCRVLAKGRNGVKPRFTTPDAYITVVQARRDVTAAFVDALARLPRPADAPGLPAAVASEFQAVRHLLDEVEKLARSGRLDDAATAWRMVDPRIDEAIAPLSVHGAAPCNQQGD